MAVSQTGFGLLLSHGSGYAKPAIDISTRTITDCIQAMVGMNFDLLKSFKTC